jgi:hypothetical protein
MTDPNSLNELTDGWPAGPDQADVEVFAQSLASKLPQLSDDALRHIEATMREELTSQRRRRWRKRIALAGAMAASIGVGVLLLRPNDRTLPSAPNSPSGPSVAAVHDTYRVPVLVLPAPATPEKPLIAVDSYQGLFSN